MLHDTKTERYFDVIVIGGGHAGIEAAWVASRMGSKTALISLDITKIGTMPCNPAIGGIGKGHLVFEISAMGGLMPQLCTNTYLQARMLNTKKGPAVQGLRLQIDKHAYSALSQKRLALAPNLSLIEGCVDNITLTDNGTIRSIILSSGEELLTKSIVVTTGTFLNGKIHIGTQHHAGGRRDEQAVTTLSNFFKKHDFKLGRLKTGTPPRLLTSSLDFNQMEQQEPDNLGFLFEFYPHKAHSSHACYITHTNENTHDIIRKNLHRSAMYSGNIEGIGPRYCPSIEDKISRFAGKNAHHVFVEPEDATMEEIYPNGLSTSLPTDVQEAYIRSIKGFQNAIISKWGYAIEYDFVYPNQLHATLETKKVPGLFLAGQINGTTGYEEAAAQGLAAGINAHLKAHNKEPFIFDRTESYIGVMIDDLITMGIDEPYRMFTSRAEHRLLLRQDNAFLRLTDKAYHLGLIDQTLYEDFCKEKELIETVITQLKKKFNTTKLLTIFTNINTLEQTIIHELNITLPPRAVVTVQAALMYEPYIKREELEIIKRKQYQAMIIPATLEIKGLPGLSKELQEKMLKVNPGTIAQAALIPGMTPAAIALLVFKIREIAKKVGFKQLSKGINE